MLCVLAAGGVISATLSITADTGSERDCLWSNGERTTAAEYWRRVIEPYCASNGIEAAFVRAQDKTGQPLPPLIEKMKNERHPVGVPMFGGRGGRLLQNCTDKYKIRAIRQELRRRGATTACIAIGLTMSETERMKLSDVKWNWHHWPLIDLKMYRSQIQEELDRRNIPYLISTECDMCPHKDRSRWERTSKKVIDECAEIEKLLPGLYFTDQRIPLKQVIKNMGAQPSLFDSCDSGYCFT
jgi:hypothetical protein